MKRLVLFDFDGTLIQGDSMMAFLRYTHSTPAYWGKCLMAFVPVVYYFFLKKDRQKAKEKLLSVFFKGWSETRLRRMSLLFTREVLPKMLHKETLGVLQHYKNDRRILVSASLDIWLEDFCRIYELELVCTQAQYESAIFSGRIQGKNCIGPEKVLRVKAHIADANYTTIIAYGDTSGDKEMLDWADHSFYQSLETL